MDEASASGAGDSRLESWAGHWYRLFRPMRGLSALKAGLLCVVSLLPKQNNNSDSRDSISGLVVEYIIAIDVTQVRFPADAIYH